MKYNNLNWLVAAIAGLVITATLPAAAQFKIEEPEAEKGSVELEYDGAWQTGIPRRRFVIEDPGTPDQEIEADGNSVARQVHAFEVGLGITNYFKLSLGLEFEQERLDDIDDVSQLNKFDDLRLSEVEIEGTFVFVPLKKDGIGFGAQVGFSHATESSEGNQFKIGPLLTVANGPWSATGNLFFLKSFGGGEFEDGVRVRDERWDLTYAWQLKYEVNTNWALAVEGYGDVNRLGDSGTRDEASLLFGDFDQHRLGPVVYYTFGLDRGKASVAPMKLGRMNAGKGKDDDDDKKKSGKVGAKDDDDDDDDDGPKAKLGAGVLFGLNDNTPDVALKWSLSVEF